MLKVLETDLGESLKSLSQRTIEGFSMMLKQFETEVDQGLERIFAEYKNEAANISGGLETFSLKFTSCAQRKIWTVSQRCPTWSRVFARLVLLRPLRLRLLRVQQRLA